MNNKKAFKYYQTRSSSHPLTCANGHGKLIYDYTDCNNQIHLKCPDCDYKQTLPYDFQNFIVSFYKNYLKDRRLKINFVFIKYYLWIGVFIDKKRDTTYIFFLPMIGLKIRWENKNSFIEKYCRREFE